MRAFFIENNTIFYWAWLVFLFIRTNANYHIFKLRGDEEMDAYGNRARPDYMANIMVYFTFRFDADPSDSPGLKNWVRFVNFLHLVFVAYSVFVFFVFLFTFGKKI